MSKRQDKLPGLLKELASEFINRESNRESLITVTSASLSPDERLATIFVTVLPESNEDDALYFLKRQGSNFRTYIAKHSRLMTLPFIEFRIDEGEKNRQRIDALLKE